MTIQEHYIYNPSDLPKHGWIHSCIECREYTARTIFFKAINKKNVIHEFHIHCCPRCKKRHNDISNYIKFSKICDNAIMEKYRSLLTSR
jgi:hypothetical protein